MRALDGLDLTVPRGAVFGLLGPNGAGKTTLVKLALGIAHPSGGEVRILGRPGGDVAVRARVGYLPENHRYPAHLTGAQVLDFFGRLSGLPEPARSLRVEGLLRRVRMEEWRATPVRKYSKGMMQRLGLAQAILNDPDFLILDEPTDGVDPVGRREIRDLLLEQKARGATIFLNSHLLSEVERLCDRVAILKSGKLVREGGIDELTRTKSAWEIDVRAPSAPALAAIVAATPGLRPAPPAAGAAAAGTTMLEIEGAAADMNRALDALRAGGVGIDAVRPRRESLEEVFVKVIRDGDAG
ncbi:MAG TPA: ABC transporter ATP-binding protein [Patescibacteria group bacterium]|nr:ABC transporter ATP-binding protein [Patescibacteria group bacterium]